MGDVEEKLKLYVSQEVKALRSELLTLIADRTNVGGEQATADQLQKGAKCDETAVPTSAEHLFDEAAVPASAEHLEQQDSHVLRESIWECSALIGLDCIGAGESLALLVLLFLNGFLQVSFCIIINNSGMLADPLSGDMLDSLLRFRTSVAHDVLNANTVSQRSLLAQVCAGEEHLHISGPQRTLFGDLTDFQGTGRVLCILALFCWGTSIIAELRGTLRFAFAVWHRRAQSTLVLARRDGEVLTIESLSSFHVVKVFILGVVPRLFSAALLCSLGFVYLFRTSKLEDLLLNAMALAFILDVDELLFTAFAPSRVRSLMGKLAPIHLETTGKRVHHSARACGSLPGVVLQFIILGVALLVVDRLQLIPLQVRVQQARDILCSGNLDFVYSISSATGMVVATSSSSVDSSWAAAECAVLHVAHPDLRENPVSGWIPPKDKCNDLDMTQLDVASAPVIFRPVGIAEARFEEAEFKYVSLLASATVQQAVTSSLCKDQVLTGVESIYRTALQDAVAAQNSTLVVSSCSDVDQFCHQMNMTRVRTLCPHTCQCAYWGFTRSGFFKTPTYGCPMQCQVQALAMSNFWKAEGIDPVKCVDFDKSDWSVDHKLPAHKMTSHIDYDQDGNITEKEMLAAVVGDVVGESAWAEFFRFDADGDGVWDATERAHFVALNSLFERIDLDDDERLSGAEVQAALANASGLGVYLDPAMDADADGTLTFSEVAGREVGEVKALPPSSVVGSLKYAPDFLSGMGEYLLSLPDFEENLKVHVQLIGGLSGWNATQEDSVVKHMASGGASEDWEDRNWVFAPGIPHPRGLVWCEFLASWELQMLLRIDFCGSSDFSSLRTLCPQSCGCQAHFRECPYSCPSAMELARDTVP